MAAGTTSSPRRSGWPTRPTSARCCGPVTPSARASPFQIRRTTDERSPPATRCVVPHVSTGCEEASCPGWSANARLGAGSWLSSSPRAPAALPTCRRHDSGPLSASVTSTPASPRRPGRCSMRSYRSQWSDRGPHSTSLSPARWFSTALLDCCEAAGATRWRRYASRFDAWMRRSSRYLGSRIRERPAAPTNRNAVGTHRWQNRYRDRPSLLGPRSR